jgi:hypothetical protein
LLRLLALPNSLPPALILARKFVMFWCASLANFPQSGIGKKRLFSRSVFGAASATVPGTDSQRADVRFGSKADMQAAFGYYCWWARVLKFVEHHP